MDPGIEKTNPNWSRVDSFDFDLLEMEKRPGTTAGWALFTKVMDGGSMEHSRTSHCTTGVKGHSL